jgi:flagellin
MTAAISGRARANLLALQLVSNDIDDVQKRLATGKRVNSAFDDPSAFFVSSSLNARAASLNQLVDTVSGVKKAVDAANNGIQAITSLLSTAQGLATSALQSTNTLVKVNGVNGTPLTTASVIATTGGSTFRLKAGDTITVNDGTTTGTYTAANNDTVQTLLNAINGTANLKATASLNSNGQITFSATGTNNITIGSTLGGTGTLVGVTGLSNGTTSFTANALRTNYAAQFDAIRAQIDSAVNDASFNGINLLSGGSKTVTLNESGSATVTLSGTNISSVNLGVSASINGFQIDSDITTALANITSALATVQLQTSALGNSSAIIDARSQFNKSMAATLLAGADDLVKSDSTADGSLLLALQSRQQLAATSLSLTNSNDKMALRLLGYN